MFLEQYLECTLFGSYLIPNEHAASPMYLGIPMYLGDQLIYGKNVGRRAPYSRRGAPGASARVARSAHL